MATQTPQREESTPVAAGSFLSKQDLEWTTEHARQVTSQNDDDDDDDDDDDEKHTCQLQVPCIFGVTGCYASIS